MEREWNKGLLWAGPVAVLTFVVILAIMYGLVGSENSLGIEGRERPETPDVTPAALNQPQQDNLADTLNGQPEQGGRLVHQGQFPAGIGQDQIQLINKPTFPAGIGDGQIQLINKPTFPAGIGNGQIQLINKPTFPAGIGDGQIQLINQNRPGGPYLGLSLGEVNGAVTQELNLPKGTGVYVNGVVNTSPAQKAGIKTGDVILKSDHKAVNNPEGVAQILATKKAGDVIKLVVSRNGTKKSFQVKLENAPMGLQVGAIQNPAWMGADIQDIDAVMKIQFNLPDNRGVIVSHVAKTSPAQAAGLQAGDVIRRFGATRIRDVKQLQELILGSQPGQKVQLAILRDGQQGTLDLTVGQKSPNPKPNVPFLGPAEVAIEGTWIGMDVVELTPDGAAGLGLPAGTTGILVEDVESPPATMVGFQTNDVLVAINGQPTPDMKAFEAATKQQSGAVVDVIRGNRHVLISVPPPGFTAQGTQINTGLNNKMRQVAMTSPVNGRLGILAAGPDLNAGVAGNINSKPYLILVDFGQNAFAAVDPNNLNPMAEAIRQYGITGLVCADISPDTALRLASQGVVVYPGVTGSVWDAIGLYEASRLVSMKGLN
jgi:serine protease Do